MLSDNAAEFEICNKAWHEINKRHQRARLATEYPERERIFMLAWTASGIIENGGFRYLFESTLPGDPNYKYTVHAFERIGCQEAADVFKQALGLFPDGVPPSDTTARLDLYDKKPNEIRKSIDSRFWGLLSKITNNLARYISMNGLGESKEMTH